MRSSRFKFIPPMPPQAEEVWEDKMDRYLLLHPDIAPGPQAPARQGRGKDFGRRGTV